MPKKGYKQTEEHRNKIGEAKKGEKNPNWGKHFSEKHKEKISRNSTHYWKGKHLSEEHIKKISEGKKGIRHSEKAKRKIGKSQKGSKSHFWKGGITPENRKVRASINFRLWREVIFAMDNWTCQKCKVKGTYLHPHHLQNFTQYPELRFAIDNGTTLCKGCHMKFHHIYGRKNNTKEQLKEFLVKGEA